ncbi:uncharacterized protein LOC128454740 [Pleuronectes platessa]|uniref:uncharacterized protein LOC128454740 n=1 Tax=Pleuronectes platessa TaxID=8262 RepID=UPI00232A2CF9|nr:uncharacterized protein LOC128454740 [Pleuronectes platessa]XP_053294231.1 uncharacterized protein LOC128454740 [Pleuronectes platessa]
MDFVGSMEVAALGRPFSLGMLYDCRKDLLVPGMTLWNRDDLKKDIGERPQNSNDFEIVASDSIEDKSSALNVEASLKASFLGGLVEVEGSAKYLKDHKTSRNQARVTLKYKATTNVKELSMNHLGRANMKHPEVFEKGLATHVVTAILYGAQAFFVFDREMSKGEDHQEIQGNLKVVIKKLPCISIEGEGSLHMEDKEKANVEKFSCKFHGDFCLEKNPVSFQDAVEVYQSLPKLLGSNGEKAVPLKVWLLPLTSLDSTAAKLVRQISVGLVQEAQTVLEDFSELEMRCNDAMRTTTAQQFPQIGKKLKSFKEMCSVFKLEFQRTLSLKLPSIRGGGEEEAVLAEILMKRHSSPFSSRNLTEWMDSKEREISSLRSYINIMKNIKTISSQNGLDEEILSAEQVLCFVFTSVGDADSFLSASSNYSPSEPTKPDKPQQQWFTSQDIANKMRKQAKLFRDFAEANKENKKIKFLMAGLTNETQKGSSIYLYEDGFSVKENFEPPSKPESVKASDINHNSVTLKISPPRSGAENITSYSVEYCVHGEDGWKQKTASKDGDVTVSDLSPNTEYVFRCRAVTSVGVGPVNEASGTITTLPCSPPGKPRVEPHSSEITVSWQRPAELGQDVHVLSYIVEYAQADKVGKGENLQWNQTMSGAEEVIISELQLETEYVVRVRCDCGGAGRSKESISVNVCTKNVKPLTEFLTCTSVRSQSSELLSVNKLRPTQDDMVIGGCRMFNFGETSMKRNRTMILFGESGSGKSTLINGMINYIVGVEWDDNFRYNFIVKDHSRSEAESQTPQVTVYKLNHQEGFKISFSLTIVDIPGDIEDIERQMLIVEQLRNLFFAEEGISEIDAVCFVALASSARLTPKQKYVFDSVLSMFGKDVAENIRILVTFVGSQRPPVLEAINEADVPCPKTKEGLPVHFKFNNSALFAKNKSSAAESASGEDDEGDFDEMFWNMGIKCMKKFFTALNVMTTKSLTMTKDVLRKRKQLEVSVQSLKKQVKIGLNKLEEIKETTSQLRDHEAEISRNKDFVIEVNKRIPDRGSGIIGKFKEVKEKTTVKDLKEKYLKASEAATAVRSQIDRLKAEYDLVQAEVVKVMGDSTKCLNRLKEIALKPNHLSTPEYINMLIEGEKAEAKSGWKTRVQYLSDMREQAEFMAKVERGEEILQSSSSDFQSFL